MSINELLVPACNRLILKIKVIGYAKQGECIIFELFDEAQNITLYRGLIDSFRLSDLHIALKYLEDIQAPPLDFLCWTHPDNDHSAGLLEIIKDHCDENTKFAVPATLDEKLNASLDLTEKHKGIFDEMQKKWINNPINFTMVSGGFGNRIEEIFFTDAKRNKVEFRIWGIAPHGGDTRLWRETKNERVKNILSVGLEIEFGPYRFIFAGDMPDESIIPAYDGFFQNPVWLKIPHHGSTHSQYMSKKVTYDSNNLYACTTVFTAQHLPVDNVLNQYLDNSGVRIDSTGTGDKKYGIIDYSFDLFRKLSVRISHEGNAIEYGHS